MIREDLGGTYLAFVSSKRSDSVKHNEERMKGPATWYVGKGEAEAYRKEARPDSVVIEAGSEAEARNMALAHAWMMDKTCLLLEDDIVWMRRVKTDENWKQVGDWKTGVIKDYPVFDACLELVTKLSESSYYLGGFQTNYKDFYFGLGDPVNSNLPVVGVVMAVKPCDLFFDTTFKFKIDFDYTLQHFTKYGGSLRINYIRVFHKQNRKYREEGLADYKGRSIEDEIHSVMRLKEKWGDLVAPHHKFAYELKFKLGPNKLDWTRQETVVNV